MALRVERPGQWSGHLFLVDPRAAGPRRAALTHGRTVARLITPALDNLYLLHRLRTRSAANERARIARELHDGIIQGVMGVQIQMHALGPRLASRSKALEEEISRLGRLLRDEVLGLRDLMYRMQPIDLPPERLMDTIADIVQRFQYESGIRTRFITQYDKVDLAPRACREVTRLVQEALVNVRKHSGAKHVFVRFMLDDGMCRLSIDDDGRGFPFSGRLLPTDRDWARQAPRVIKERVQLLGGKMAVESAPNQGARLDISIPLENPYAVSR